jgi:YrbI family 3-deoxy-D-manno-octulosonate 8-phosphate phosphatase
MSDLRSKIALIVFDFDGVLTDNRVLVLQDGQEAVFCNRGDGLAFDMFRRAKIPAVIMSTEKNPVVAARAAKLKVPCLQGLGDKASALRHYCGKQGITLDRVAFVGNDLNDIEAMKLVRFPLAVADAHSDTKAVACMVLATRGGGGVAREIAERLLGLTEFRSADAEGPDAR